MTHIVIASNQTQKPTIHAKSDQETKRNTTTTDTEYIVLRIGRDYRDYRVYFFFNRVGIPELKHKSANTNKKNLARVTHKLCFLSFVLQQQSPRPLSLALRSKS